MLLKQRSKIGDDFLEMIFDDYSNFEKEMIRREEETERIDIDVDDIEFLTSDDAYDQGFTDPDCLITMGFMYLKIGKDRILPIAETAWGSIKTRIDIFGRGLRNINNELLKNVLNEAIKRNRTVKLIIVDEKVRAILTTGYKEIPSVDVLKNLMPALNERFGKINFVYSTVNYEIARMYTLFEDKQDKLKDLYDKHDFRPGLYFTTSDTGNSGNNIFPVWMKSNNCCVIFQDEAFLQCHRGEQATVENIIKEVPNIFNKLMNVAEKVKAQKAYEVKYPYNVIKNICEYIKSKGAIDAITESIKVASLLKDEPIFTAYEITELFEDYVMDLNDDDKSSWEFKLGRIYNLSYEKMDKK